MRPGIDQSVIRWMPFLVLLLGLWMTGAVQAAEGPEDGQAVADKIAEFTTKPIYNLDTDHLLTSLETYLEERPAIKALTITETIDDERLLTYYRQSGKAVYDRPIPDDLLKLQRFTAFSVFEGEQIGLVEVYYSGATGIRLSEEERAWLADHPRIRVHNESDWPPFNFAENGAPRGYSIDYMNLLAERVGLQVEYVTGPSWNEFMGMMRSGELDIMLNIVKTPDRLEYLLFTPPYADNPNAILSRRGALYENLEQLSGKTVSLPKGFFFEEILKRDFPDIELNLVRNVLEAMKEVSFGRADAALGELAVLNHLLGEHMMTDLVVSGEVDLGDPELSLLNIATREDLPILASILTKGVESITLKERRALRAKWLGVGERREPSAPSVALTPAERAWIEAHPKIRLAPDPDFPPIEYFDENGEYVGLAADLVRMIAERTGLEIEIVRKRDWGEALEAFRNREVDMAGSMVEDDDTRQFMNFTTPYEEFPSVLIVRNDRQGSVRPNRPGVCRRHRGAERLARAHQHSSERSRQHLADRAPGIDAPLDRGQRSRCGCRCGRTGRGSTGNLPDHPGLRRVERRPVGGFRPDCLHPHPIEARGGYRRVLRRTRVPIGHPRWSQRAGRRRRDHELAGDHGQPGPVGREDQTGTPDRPSHVDRRAEHVGPRS